jgi:hypothetical protein
MNNLSASKKPTSKLFAVLTGGMLLKRNMIASSKAEDVSSAFAF